MVKNETISKYLKKLSSSSPTPGGGSVSALTGAISSSLVEMVAKLTLGRKGYERHFSEMRKIIKEASSLKKDFLKLSSDDIEVFNQVMAAYKISPDENNRNLKIQNSLKNATKIPLDVSEKAKRLIDMSDLVIKIGNKNAYSDAKTALYLAKAAKLSALENVKINLKSIKDRKFIIWVEKRIKNL